MLVCFVFPAGVEYELYYVRNGIINQYALSFDLPLQSHIDEIYFNWQNLRDDPPVSQYSLWVVWISLRIILGIWALGMTSKKD